MSANYTPNLGEYTELTPFRYWCQKVMPLVYDDSLSYYELLCKVVDYLNKTMHDVDTLHTDVVQLHAAYVQLQQYVNTYFENLDIQSEIDRKLDEMAESGSLLNIIKPSVIDSVNSWLTAHITNPSNPPIDKSLTIENAAADSKITGDKINSLKEELANSFTSKKNLCTDLKQNTAYTAWGGIGTSVIRENINNWTSATVKLNGDEEFITMTVKTDEKPFSFFADANGKMISHVIDHLIEGNVYSVPSNAKFLYGSIQTKNIKDINLGMVVFKGKNPITQNDFNITDVPYGKTRFFADDLKTTDGTSIIEIEKKIKPIYVEKDGSGDFSRLIDAIEEAEKTMNRVVYVGAGEWDIIEELGTDYIESINTLKRGVYLKNGIHLICSSRSIIKCNYTGSNPSTIEWLSAFNAGPYGFVLENATIESSNCRYTIHDERDSDEDHYKNVYKNCFMKHTKTCIGGGLGLDGHVIIDGCKFVNNQGDNSHVVSYHNSGDGYWEGTASKGAQSNVEVADSWFSGTLAVQTFGQSKKDTNFLVHGNSFASAPIYPLEPNPVIKVTDWNNEIRNN